MKNGDDRAALYRSIAYGYRIMRRPTLADYYERMAVALDALPSSEPSEHDNNRNEDQS